MNEHECVTETPSTEKVASAIRSVGATTLRPVRLASICDALFPETKTVVPGSAKDAFARERAMRAVDRGLQAAKKAGMVTFDSKTGWSVTGVSK